jgi:hypothetical protein
MGKLKIPTILIGRSHGKRQLRNAGRYVAVGLDHTEMRRGNLNGLVIGFSSRNL